jgi:hypothetical protein
VANALRRARSGLQDPDRPIGSFVFLGPRMRKVMPEGHSLTEFVWFRFGRVMYVVTLCVMVQ